MNKLLWTVTCALSLFIGSLSVANACGCGKGMHQMVDSVKLDAAQKEKVKPILDQLKATIKENADQMNSIETQLKQQLTSGKMDQSTVNGLVDKKVQLIGNIIKAKMQAKTQIYAVLNDKQKAEFQENMKKEDKKWEKEFKNCSAKD